ncbi:MAG: MAPEG family protein [Pseudomonadota bacterium]
MPIPDITILYAGILGVMAVGLGATAGTYRAKNGISIGDGGDPQLTLRMRRHANFVENVPLALVLFALLEMQGVTHYAIHGLGIALVVGRMMHWIGFGESVNNPVRGIGAGLTVLSIAVASIWGIITFLQF